MLLAGLGSVPIRTDPKLANNGLTFLSLSRK